MKRYNHAFKIAFSLDHNCPTGECITGQEFTNALRQRIDDINSCGDLEWFEAVGEPYDTYENQDENHHSCESTQDQS